MHDALRAPPWANLWRHLVTTYLFFLAIGFSVALVTDLDTNSLWSSGLLAIAVVAYVLAAVVVWSDIPWPGDPE
jgi:mannose/fructose/N-acetylgalactosamine-specific phosphotransferase system component IIC